jgi:hypothetical protein
MVRTVRTCDDHQDESWVDECLHCSIEALEKKLSAEREYAQGNYAAFMDTTERAEKLSKTIAALEKNLDRIGAAASYACNEADEDWEKGRVSIDAHDAVQALKAILDAVGRNTARIMKKPRNLNRKT